MELFDLAKDPSEKKNLAGKHPEMVKTLSGAFDAWIAPMPDPITRGKKRWEPERVEKDLTEREKERLRKRMERKKKREAEKKKKESQSTPTKESAE